MTILNIETSTFVCSAALSCDGSVVLPLISNDNTNHASTLPLFVEEILKYTRQHDLALDAVALSSGPGSYTGLRIGTSIAKGICYANNIPLLPIDTLKIIATGAKRLYENMKKGVVIGENTIFCPMMDARRMEVYTALFDSDLNRLTDTEAKIIEQGSYVDLLEEKKVVFAGNGVSKCRDLLAHQNAEFLFTVVPDAADMVGMAEEQLAAIQADPTLKADVAYYTPFYLKDYVAAHSEVKGLR